jgi:hypothetical protein
MAKTEKSSRNSASTLPRDDHLVRGVIRELPYLVKSKIANHFASVDLGLGKQITSNI